MSAKPTVAAVLGPEFEGKRFYCGSGPGSSWVEVRPENSFYDRGAATIAIACWNCPDADCPLGQLAITMRRAGKRYERKHNGKRHT